jgi:hypothetical protein
LPEFLPRKLPIPECCGHFGVVGSNILAEMMAADSADPA